MTDDQHQMYTEQAREAETGDLCAQVNEIATWLAEVGGLDQSAIVVREAARRIALGELGSELASHQHESASNSIRLAGMDLKEGIRCALDWERLNGKPSFQTTAMLERLIGKALGHLDAALMSIELNRED